MPSQKRSGLEDIFGGGESSSPANGEALFPLPGEPQSALDQIRTAHLKPKHVDHRQREPVVTYRGIPETLQRSLERLAENLDVPLGILVRYLLEHGLEEATAGRLLLNPQLVKVGLTLYPEKESGPHKMRRLRAKGAVSKPVAYRGIPAATHRAIIELAEKLGVPIGEVARFLLEHGAEQVRTGALHPATYPRQTAVRTLYPE
jgi:hypothetical protein